MEALQIEKAQIKDGSKNSDGLLHRSELRATIKTGGELSKAVIYTRVSTAEQAENKQSLDSQETACRDFAAKHDFEIDKVFREEGESAKTADRTKLLEMLKYCQQNKGTVKYVLVYKVDRFARRAEDHLTLKAMLLKLGVRIFSATEPIEDSNTGKLMETILAGFAEFDNGVRSERSGNGMRARLEEGGWVHIAPTGWKNVKDELRRPTIEPDVDTGPKVKRLLREFLKGTYSQKQIIELAQQYGLKNSPNKKNKDQPLQPISGNTVLKILHNPLNAGMVHGKSLKEPIKGLHWEHRYIEPEEHQAILNILAGKKKAFLPEARAKPLWPLRRFAKCNLCGHGMTGSISRGRTKQYAYYHCVQCKGRVRELRKVAHSEFEARLNAVKPADDILQLFKQVVIRRWNEEFREVHTQRRQIDNELEQWEVRRQAILDKNFDGKIDDETTSEQLQRVGIKKAELRLARSELFEGEVEKETIVDYAINFMASASRLWKVADLEDKQRFQKMVFPEGITYIFGQGFGTAKTGECYDELQRLTDVVEQALNKKLNADTEKSLLVTSRRIELRLPG
jgi:site-specific DNA recombinase